MHSSWKLIFSLIFCLLSLVWLQVVAPPWLALFLVLVWFRKGSWYLRSTVMLVLGLLWSSGAGISGLWGILSIALLFWFEKLGEAKIQDGRWRIWLVAGAVSVFWSWPAGIAWSASVVFWWIIQGVVAGLIIRSFRQKSL